MVSEANAIAYPATFYHLHSFNRATLGQKTTAADREFQMAIARLEKECFSPVIIGLPPLRCFRRLERRCLFVSETSPFPCRDPIHLYSPKIRQRHRNTAKHKYKQDTVQNTTIKSITDNDPMPPFSIVHSISRQQGRI